MDVSYLWQIRHGYLSYPILVCQITTQFILSCLLNSVIFYTFSNFGVNCKYFLFKIFVHFNITKYRTTLMYNDDRIIGNFFCGCNLFLLHEKMEKWRENLLLYTNLVILVCLTIIVAISLRNYPLFVLKQYIVYYVRLSSD